MASQGWPGRGKAGAWSVQISRLFEECERVPRPLIRGKGSSLEAFKHVGIPSKGDQWLLNSHALLGTVNAATGRG